MASTGKSSKVQCRNYTGLGHFSRECPTTRIMVPLDDGGYKSTSDYEEETLALIAHEEQCAAAPTDQEAHYMAADYADKFPSLIAQRVLSAQVTKAEPNQRHNLFHTTGVVKD
jgi:hypothetical protein